MIIPIINTKLRHPIRRIIQHKSDQRINRTADHPPRLLVVIYIHRIPAEAKGLVIVGPLGEHPVAMLGNMVVDLVEGITEHFDDDGTYAVAGLAAIEIVDFYVGSAGGGAPKTGDFDGDGRAGLEMGGGDFWETAVVKEAMGDGHVSAGGFCKESCLNGNKGIASLTYVPILVLPSLAQT